MILRDNARHGWLALIIAIVLSITVVGCQDPDDSGAPAQSSSAPDSTETSTPTQPTATTSTSSASGSLVVPTSVADAMSANVTPTSASSPSANVTALALNSSSLPRGVTRSGSDITIVTPGTYRVTGSLSGRLIVNCPDGVLYLILDGVNIESSQVGGLIVSEGDLVTLELAAGSSNTVSDVAATADPSEDDPNAAIHSKADLVITGSGTLQVDARVDGIASTDGLVINLAGNITVTSGDDALRGKDYLVIAKGTLDLQAVGDALKSTQDTDAARGYVWVSGGNLTATAGTDCIDAQTDVLISSGTLHLTCGDDGLHGEVLALIEGSGTSIDIVKSYEGIEAPVIAIYGGRISVVSSDDALNAAGGDGSDAPNVPGTGNPGQRQRPGGGGPGGMGDGDPSKYFLLIAGGELTIDAEGDGLDSNGYASITGGKITIYGPVRSGNGPLDSSGLSVTGGVLIALGSSGMAETPTKGNQAWLGATFPAAAGDTITVEDATDATKVWEFKTKKTSQLLVFSTPDLVTGRTYSISVNGTQLGTLAAT